MCENVSVKLETTIESGKASGLSPEAKTAVGNYALPPKNQEVMVYLKQVMQQGRLYMSYEWQPGGEMNVGRCQPIKTG